jgi:hypothetical protein
MCSLYTLPAQVLTFNTYPGKEFSLKTSVAELEPVRPHHFAGAGAEARPKKFQFGSEAGYVNS